MALIVSDIWKTFPHRSHPHPLLRLGAARRANINPQIFDLTRLFSLLPAHNMDRLLANHPYHIPLLAQQPHPLTH